MNQALTRNPACRDQRRDGALTDEPVVERPVLPYRQVGKRSVNSLNVPRAWPGARHDERKFLNVIE
jgi:hypothetical protein